MEEKRSLNKLFNPQRSLLLPPSFDEKEADRLVFQLYQLSLKKGDIVCQINSKGGNFVGAMKLYETIRINPIQPIGLVAGDAFSAAIIVLQACKYRYATKYSRLLIHRPEYPIQFTLKPSDQLSDLIKLLDGELIEIRRKDELLLDILQARMKIDREDIKKLMNDSKMIHPNQALEIGLIDEII
jgi:ATP-dependent protease ClpP protease subunit